MEENKKTPFFTIEENKLKEVIYAVTVRYHKEPKEIILESIHYANPELFHGSPKEKIEFNRKLAHYFNLRNDHGRK